MLILSQQFYFERLFQLLDPVAAPPWQRAYVLLWAVNKRADPSIFPLAWHLDKEGENITAAWEEIGLIAHDPPARV